MTPELQALFDSGNWMIRVDENGVGYDGFKWKPIGERTECPKWTAESEQNPTCENGGLFGQSPAAGGYCNVKVVKDCAGRSTKGRAL